MGRTDPTVFATGKSQIQAAGDWLWTWPGSEGKTLWGATFPQIWNGGTLDPHIDLWGKKKKKTKPCTPVSLEIDADFTYFYLEIHHAHQHIGGSNKSCWIEFDRLLSHYGLPNFHGQRTICLWPSRPLLPLLPSFLDWVLTAGKRTKVPPGYPQVQSWII